MKDTEKFKETGNYKYIHRNDLDKACFQHDMVYGDTKDLPRNPMSKKTLRGKAFAMASNQRYDKCQQELAPVICKYFDKKDGDTKPICTGL